MPATTVIVLADGKSTPENHTFSPKAIDRGNASFQDLAAATILGRDELILVSADAQGGQAVKVTLRLRRPMTQSTTDSAGKTTVSVKYQYLGVIELYLPKAGTAAERDDMRTLMSNALVNASVASVIDNIEWFW